MNNMITDTSLVGEITLALFDAVIAGEVDINVINDIIHPKELRTSEELLEDTIKCIANYYNVFGADHRKTHYMKNYFFAQFNQGYSLGDNVCECNLCSRGLLTMALIRHENSRSDICIIKEAFRHYRNQARYNFMTKRVSTLEFTVKYERSPKSLVSLAYSAVSEIEISNPEMLNELLECENAIVMSDTEKDLKYLKYHHEGFIDALSGSYISDNVIFTTNFTSIVSASPTVIFSKEVSGGYSVVLPGEDYILNLITKV